MMLSLTRFPGRSARRALGLGLVGLTSLALVVGCSTYGTTGSGGTNGANPAGGSSAGTGAGGSLPTPSGSSNSGGTSASAASGGQESKTAGPPGVAPVSVPTSGTSESALEERTGTRPGGIGAESNGTPMGAGTGGVAATREAVTGSAGGNTVPGSPGTSAGTMNSTPIPTVTPTGTTGR